MSASTESLCRKNWPGIQECMRKAGGLFFICSVTKSPAKTSHGSKSKRHNTELKCNCHHSLMVSDKFYCPYRITQRQHLIVISNCNCLCTLARQSSSPPQREGLLHGPHCTRGHQLRSQWLSWLQATDFFRRNVPTVFFFNPVSTNSPPGMEMAQPFWPPAPVPGCLHGEKASPDHQAEHLLFLFMIVASYPTAICCSEDFKPSLLPYREDITEWGYQDGTAGELAMQVHARRLGKVQSGEGMALGHPNSTPVGGKES